LQSDTSNARSLLRKSLNISRKLGFNRGIGQTLVSLGNIAVADNLEDGRLLLEESLDINRKFGNKVLIAPALNNLGIFASMRSNLTVAYSLHEEALSVSQELGDKRAIAFSLFHLGRITHVKGDYDRANSLLEKSLAICQELDNIRMVSELYCQLAIIACKQNNFNTANLLLRESLIISQNLGVKSDITGFIGEWAYCQALQNSHKKAAQFWGSAEASREFLQIKQFPFEWDRHNREIVVTREHLGEIVFKDVWSEGRLLTIDEAILLALDNI